jgi:hypothetical protein
LICRSFFCSVCRLSYTFFYFPIAYRAAYRSLNTPTPLYPPKNKTGRKDVGASPPIHSDFKYFLARSPAPLKGLSFYFWWP